MSNIRTLAEQRCWNHRIANVLDAMPKKHQAEARTLLCAMPYAETQAACEALRAEFTTRYRKLAPKAVERLADDWERLVTFYQFPREHWPHLRTTNVVESPFATVRLRTTAAKRFKKVENATALIWKMLQVAESTFRRLKGAELLPAVYAGAQYVDGVQRSYEHAAEDGCLTARAQAFSLSRRARRSKEAACAVPSCGFENPEGLKFCEECGTRSRTSLSELWQLRIAPQAKFCGECGTTLGAAGKPAPAKSRKRKGTTSARKAPRPAHLPQPPGLARCTGSRAPPTDGDVL